MRRVWLPAGKTRENPGRKTRKTRVRKTRVRVDFHCPWCAVTSFGVAPGAGLPVPAIDPLQASSRRKIHAVDRARQSLSRQIPPPFRLPMSGIGRDFGTVHELTARHEQVATDTEAALDVLSQVQGSVNFHGAARKAILGVAENASPMLTLRTAGARPGPEALAKALVEALHATSCRYRMVCKTSRNDVWLDLRSRYRNGGCCCR